MNSLKRKDPDDDGASAVSATSQKSDYAGAENIKVNVNIELLKSGKYSDFEIQAQDHVFKVHRILIEGKSHVIDRSVDGGFKETIERHLELNASKEAVAVLLWFMYTEEVDKPFIAFKQLLGAPYDYSPIKQIMVTTDLYYLADYLLMPHLQMKAFNLLGRMWRELIFSFQHAKLQHTELKTNEEMDLEFGELVTCVFSDDKTFELIRRQMCWGFATLNIIECSGDYVLKDNMIMHNVNLYPQFGLGFLREMRLLRRSSLVCALCDNEHSKICHSQWLRVWSHRDKAYQWIRCICGFRGLCSSECSSDEPEDCQRMCYCKGCKGDMVKTQGVNFHRDQDGLIRCAAGCECDSDYEDSDYIPDEESSDESEDDD